MINETDKSIAQHIELHLKAKIMSGEEISITELKEKLKPLYTKEQREYLLHLLYNSLSKRKYLEIEKQIRNL